MNKPAGINYSLSKFIFLICICVITTTLPAQINPTPASTLQANFINPPTLAKPYVWWHWMGSNFSRTGITKDLEAMKAQGIGGATIFNLASAVQESHVPTLNNPWPHQTYRSPAYWEAIKHAAAEAKRLGLEIGLHNTAGYSTTGGPWIDQERGMKKLVWSKQIVMDGGNNKILMARPAPVISDGWGSQALPPNPSTWYKDIAYLAIPLSDSIKYDRTEDFTGYFDTSGLQVKTLPKGDWIVYRLGYAPTMAIPHPLPDDIMDKTYEADKMSREQSIYHWNQVLDPVKKYLAPYLGNSFKHMLIDSYEAGYQNWTPGFREQFTRIKGYDPLPWILTFTDAITNELPENAKTGNKRIRKTEEETQRFNWDYYDVINQLYFENGWQVAKDMLHGTGLQLQWEAYGGPFDSRQGAAFSDIPMGEFWSYQKEGIDAVIPAAAGAAGKNIIGAEAFTGSPVLSKFTEDPAFLKQSAIGAFSSGVNRMILHHWVHQPFDDKYQPGMGMGWWGTHFGRNQTWAEPGKAFFQYLSRSQVLLQYGEKVAEYLCVEKLQGNADLISINDFIRMPIKVVRGKIVLESGRTYPFIVFPNTNVMLPEVAEKIKWLVGQGATVVAAKPSKSPGLKNYPACDRQIAAIANEVWNDGNSNQNDKGMVFTNLDDAIIYHQVKTDYSIEKATIPKDIKIVHRRGKEADVFFVANVNPEAQQVTISVNISGMQPEIWQAENGSMMNAPVWQEKEGRTLVELNVKDYQSVFIVFKKVAVKKDHPVSIQVSENAKDWSFISSKIGTSIHSAVATNVAISYASGKSENIHLSAPKVLDIAGSWQLSLQPKLDKSFTVEFLALIDFSMHDNPAIKYFAGTAVYRKSIKMDASFLASGKLILLDLGKMNDIASVKLNGKDMGVLWYPPYTLDVTGVIKPGENTLEISVTNNWANRLIGDEQEPADFEWGSDRGINGHAMKAYPAWFIKNQPRPSKGRKTFSIWYYYRKDSPLLPAGLAGPVRLLSADQKILSGK